ncbi:MAG: hypothetical protein Q7J12_05470 [Syntrophales bacterium]|nr:hypothetical protein [Syntrophales bacterium]
MTDKEIFEQLADFQKQGIPVCLATIVDAFDVCLNIMEDCAIRE